MEKSIIASPGKSFPDVHGCVKKQILKDMYCNMISVFLRIRMIH